MATGIPRQRRTSMAQETVSKTVHLAIMNAVHDMAVIVARDEGYFRDEGLDIEFVTAPGMAQVTTDSEILKREVMFDRPLDTMFSDGGVDQYRMCLLYTSDAAD